MCGIIGIISRKAFPVKDELLGSLTRLEYRGYDSAGFATKEGSMVKKTGYISNLIAACNSGMLSDLAISHTRWSTHGKISMRNAHPHFSHDKSLFVVHNGIIENFAELKEDLEKKGCRFVSETDSEVIAHYFDHHLKKGRDMKKIMLSFQDDAQGTYAILIMRKGIKELYAIKNESPLVLGLMPGKAIISSDINAFADKTQKAVFFEDNECCVIDDQSYRFFNIKGKGIKKRVMQLPKMEIQDSKEDFPHYMLKEIKEQPKVSQRLIQSFDSIQKENLGKFAALVRKAKRVVFIACGTSYHASLIGVYLLNLQGIESHTVIASEFENFLLADKDTVVIALSQSGETMDVVSVLKAVRERGAKVASIVNVPYSTVQRYSKASIETLAGPEVCVASTKVFTNQIIALLALAYELGYSNGFSEIPKLIEKTIKDNEHKIRLFAKKLYRKNDIFVLGKGLSYPIAREIALKLKEIPYMHAEGMMAGELKHGTIALIEPKVPVIALIPNNNLDMVSSRQEVQARGADVITISNVSGEGELKVPECGEVHFTIYASIIGHLLSYYIAKLRNLPIDKPRNLAKSVTVK